MTVDAYTCVIFYFKILLANVPDYDDRCQHLEALKNRLETLVSPSIVEALTNNSQG